MRIAQAIVGNQYLALRRMDIFLDYKAYGGDKDNPADGDQGDGWEIDVALGGRRENGRSLLNITLLGPPS